MKLIRAFTERRILLTLFQLLGAYVDLKDVKKSKTAVQPTNDSTSSVALKSDVVFKTIAERMKENVAIAKSINGIFLYNITKDGQIAKKWSKFCIVQKSFLFAYLSKYRRYQRF